MASDLTLICSEFGVRLLNRIAQDMFGTARTLPRIEVLPPPVDVAESTLSAAAPHVDRPRVVYNHRLYTEYGTGTMVDLLSRAARSPDRFTVLVTNPTDGRGAQRRRLSPQLDENLARLCELPFVEVSHFARRTDYFAALGRSWGGIAPYKPHALWSMSVLDVLGVGRPVLSFDIASFREIGLPDEYLVTSEDEFLDRFARLTREPPCERDRERFVSIAKRYSGARAAQRMSGLLGLVS